MNSTLVKTVKLTQIFYCDIASSDPKRFCLCKVMTTSWNFLYHTSIFLWHKRQKKAISFKYCDSRGSGHLDNTTFARPLFSLDFIILLEILYGGSYILLRYKARKKFWKSLVCVVVTNNLELYLCTTLNNTTYLATVLPDYNLQM